MPMPPIPTKYTFLMLSKIVIVLLSHFLFKHFAAVLVASEQVKARAARRKQHDVAGFRTVSGRLDGIFQIIGVKHLAQRRKTFNQLFVVQPHADQRLNLFPNQLVQNAVVITLVLAAGNPDHRSGHAVQRIPR